MIPYDEKDLWEEEFVLDEVTITIKTTVNGHCNDVFDVSLFKGSQKFT